MEFCIRGDVFDIIDINYAKYKRELCSNQKVDRVLS